MLAHYALNLSMLLYFVLYIPQLFHNKKQKHLANLSLNFHNLLIIGYITDLIYGFGLRMPWQYCLVSGVGVLWLFIQHLQLWKIHRRNKYYKTSNYFLILLIILGVFIIFFYPEYYYLLIIGYISQAAWLIHAFPQIIKNINSATALTLSINYLLLDFVCHVCDNIAAWQLHWPLPSKIGAIISIGSCSVLLIQWLWTRQLN